MAEIHLRQARFTYSVCRRFTKNKERIQKFKDKGNSKNIYQIELDKTNFQQDKSHGDLKDLPRETISDKVLRDKISNFVKKPKYEGYQKGSSLNDLQMF